MFNSCCCDLTFGFDAGAWNNCFVFGCSNLLACANNASAIINLKDDVSRIGECRIVFAGRCDQNGNFFGAPVVRFAPADWPAIRTYIEGGGRLWLNAEEDMTPDNFAEMAGFLAAMGSGISYVSGPFDSTDSGGTAAPGDANIAQGLTMNLHYSAAGQVGGGTAVWRSSVSDSRLPDVPLVVVEKLGEGFLFFTGDGHWITTFFDPTYDFCEFFKRLWEYDNSQII